MWILPLTVNAEIYSIQPVLNETPLTVNLAAVIRIYPSSSQHDGVAVTEGKAPLLKQHSLTLKRALLA